MIALQIRQASPVNAPGIVAVPEAVVAERILFVFHHPATGSSAFLPVCQPETSPEETLVRSFLLIGDCCWDMFEKSRHW